MLWKFILSALVVATGDSLTKGYAPTKLAASLDEYRGASAQRVASGGCTTGRYLGREPDPYQDNEYHNFTVDVLASEPDVVTLMLGTNDAFRAVTDPTWVEQYKADMLTIFEAYRDVPTVIVMTPPPILPDAPEASPYASEAAGVLSSEFVPWLIESVPDEFVLLDVFHLIQQQPGWESFYHTDGIHLYADDCAGYEWLADTVAECVAEHAGLLPDGCVRRSAFPAGKLEAPPVVKNP